METPRTGRSFQSQLRVLLCHIWYNVGCKEPHWPKTHSFYIYIHIQKYKEEVRDDVDAGTSITSSSNPIRPLRITCQPIASILEVRLEDSKNATESCHPLQNESLLSIYLNYRRVVGTMSVAYEGWLPALVNSQSFFTPCTRCSGHHSARESSLNFWDIDNKEELCSICLQNDPRENVLQVCCLEERRGKILSKISSQYLYDLVSAVRWLGSD